MGTRADFYVGRGASAEWLGSVAFDGYPDGIEGAVLGAKGEGEFREAVAKFLASKSHATLPEMGWPWPWNDSRMTDYAYAFADGAVLASGFGSAWFDPKIKRDDDDDDDDYSAEGAIFPDMSARKSVTYGQRSGLIVVGFPASRR